MTKERDVTKHGGIRETGIITSYLLNYVSKLYWMLQIFFQVFSFIDGFINLN